MGLVMSHTYNLSHAYLSHTHNVKHPTSVALLRATEWLDIETDSRQDVWLSSKVLALLYSTTAISLWLTALSHAIKHCIHTFFTVLSNPTLLSFLLKIFLILVIILLRKACLSWTSRTKRLNIFPVNF